MVIVTPPSPPHTPTERTFFQAFLTTWQNHIALHQDALASIAMVLLSWYEGKHMQNGQRGQDIVSGIKGNWERVEAALEAFKVVIDFFSES